MFSKKINKYAHIILVGLFVFLMLIIGCYKILSDSIVLTSDEASRKYDVYLGNLESSIKSNYKEFSNNYISDESVNLNTKYSFTITKDLFLLFTTEDGKYNNHKLSDDVLNMFLITNGNGGFKYLYFIKTDGSLNSFCIDCLNSGNKITINKEKYKYIINVSQGLFNREDVGDYGPIFTSIEGNIYYK